MNPVIATVILVAVAVVLAAAMAAFAGSLFGSYAPNNCQCVAFRLDDVQAYWERPAQQAVISAFNNTNTPLTIGIIGDKFDNDTRMVNFVKHSNIEIANHGWLHEDFTKLSEDEQEYRIHLTNQELQSLFGKSPEVFIAPYNAIDDDTLIAAKANGIKYVSGFVDTQKFNGTQIPGTINAGDLVENNTSWSSFTADKIKDRIDFDLNKYGYSVIVLHPQVFYDAKTKSVNQEQLQQLKDLISELKHYNLTALSKVK